jgi:hypothetical protein
MIYIWTWILIILSTICIITDGCRLVRAKYPRDVKITIPSDWVDFSVWAFILIGALYQLKIL